MEETEGEKTTRKLSWKVTINDKQLSFIDLRAECEVVFSSFRVFV